MYRISQIENRIFYRTIHKKIFLNTKQSIVSRVFFLNHPLLHSFFIRTNKPEVEVFFQNFQAEIVSSLASFQRAFSECEPLQMCKLCMYFRLTFLEKESVVADLFLTVFNIEISIFYECNRLTQLTFVERRFHHAFLISIDTIINTNIET